MNCPRTITFYYLKSKDDTILGYYNVAAQKKVTHMLNEASFY